MPAGPEGQPSRWSCEPGPLLVDDFLRDSLPALVKIVFQEGGPGGKREPFFRLWLPYAKDCTAMLYIHKVATRKSFMKILQRVPGFERLSNLKPGDVAVQGPLTSTTALTGNHGGMLGREVKVPSTDPQNQSSASNSPKSRVLSKHQRTAELPWRGKMYEYETGTYVEFGEPCAKRAQRFPTKSNTFRRALAVGKKSPDTRRVKSEVEADSAPAAPSAPPPTLAVPSAVSTVLGRGLVEEDLTLGDFGFWDSALESDFQRIEEEEESKRGLAPRAAQDETRAAHAVRIILQ